MKRKIAVVAAGVLCILLAGCDLLDCLFDPACDLRGTWLIDDTDPDEPTYDRLIFHDDDTYRILGALGNIIESGSMTDVTDSDFVGTIESQVEEPGLEGTSTYAVWDVDGDTLTVRFYDDQTMATLYITFVCTRQ